MPNASAANRRQLIPFAAVSASYFAHIGFFNPLFATLVEGVGIWLGGHQHFDFGSSCYAAVCPVRLGLVE